MEIATTKYDKEFWEYYREICAQGDTPERGTEAWRLREEIILAHTYLIKRIVASMKRKMPAHVESDDLESLAAIGLLQAVERFDPSRGVPFEAYITQRARSVIGDYVRDSDWAPRSLRKKQRDITQAEEDIRKQGREPTQAEVADKLDLPVDEISTTKYKAEIASHTYIEGSVEAQHKPASANHDEDELVVLLKTTAAHVLANMEVKKAAIIALHYYEGKKLAVVAKMLRISEVKIGALHAEAVLEIWEALQNVLANE